MSQSKAQKHRKHLARNGRPDPASSRAISPDFSTHVRKTPTLLDKRRKQEKKLMLSAMAYQSNQTFM